MGVTCNKTTPRRVTELSNNSSGQQFSVPAAFFSFNMKQLDALTKQESTDVDKYGRRARICHKVIVALLLRIPSTVQDERRDSAGSGCTARADIGELWNARDRQCQISQSTSVLIDVAGFQMKPSNSMLPFFATSPSGSSYEEICLHHSPRPEPWHTGKATLNCWSPSNHNT